MEQKSSVPSKEAFDILTDNLVLVYEDGDTVQHNVIPKKRMKDLPKPMTVTKSTRFSFIVE